MFIICSDDIKWCKENIKFKNTKYRNDGGIAILDLITMANCDDNIIANSSFSWWAAELNTNLNKRVVAPKKWFNNNIDIKDLYNNNWIII